MQMVAQILGNLPTLVILFFCVNCHNFVTWKFLGTIAARTWQITENFARIATMKNNH
jgi:hypothetical protein